MSSACFPHPMIPLCIVGHVDHGKTTLAAALRRSTPAESTAGAPALRTSRHAFRLLDAPSAPALLRDLLADPLAVRPRGLVVVDATVEPARAGAQLAALPLLGIRDFVVAVNKMDLAQWRDDRLAALRVAVHAAAEAAGLGAPAVVPVCARDGTNVLERGTAGGWHGPTLAEALDRLPVDAYARGGPLRLPVREVRERGGAPVLAGRIESGTLEAGGEILVLTGNRTTRVASIDGGFAAAGAGEDVRFTIADRIAVSPGDVVVSPDSPPKLTAVFDADVCWLGSGDLAAGRRIVVRAGTREVGARIAAAHVARGGGAPASEGGIDPMRVTLRCDSALAVDDHATLPLTGRFAIVDDGEIAGVGLVDARGYPDQRRARAHAGDVVPVRHQVVEDERASRAGHRGAVVWLTGLSGAGKSTLALALERRLFDLGWGVYTLDGDNVRTGLNADLGFSPEDRQENLRRVGEVASLFADAGLVCVTAFISPYRDERARARIAAGSHPFIEVWVRSPLEECERRDPKGLYRKARAGQLKQFTGIDSPYEPPDAADLVVDTAAQGVEDCTATLVEYVVAACRRR